MTPNLRTMTTYPYTRRHRHPRMDAPPIDPGIRSLRFQGAGTVVHYRKIRFPERTPGKSGRDLTVKGKERESTGSASARNPDPGSGSDDDDESKGWTQARLDGWVKSTWIDGRQPGIVGWRDPAQQRDRGRVYWVFALDDEGVQRVDSIIPGDLVGESPFQPVSPLCHEVLRVTGTQTDRIRSSFSFPLAYRDQSLKARST